MVGSHSSQVDKSDTYILDASTSICKAALHRVTQAAVPSKGNQNLPQGSFPADCLELIALGMIYSMSNRCASLLPSHEAMLKYLLEMYDQAEAGDVIWAQCIRCTDFTPQVRTKILEAASRGVRFQIVVNQNSPAAEEFQALFDPIEGAEVTRSPNKAISMQGLSEREVVIAFPGVESYTAVLIRDKYFVGIVKSWFDRRVYKRCQAND